MSKIGWIVIGAAVVFLGALAIYNGGSSGEDQDDSSPWNQQMAKGDTEAPNKFVEYVDITCPFCAAFHNAANEGPFDKEYIDSGKVHMEIRVTSLLSNVNSVRSGESAYCAADQGKFFEYYDNIVTKLSTDFYDRGIGVSPTSPRVPQLEDDYYLEAAAEAELDTDEMATCMHDNRHRDTVNNATRRASSALPYGSGVPYFIINDFTSSGFGGDYSTVQQMMTAGGVN